MTAIFHRCTPAARPVFFRAYDTPLDVPLTTEEESLLKLRAGADEDASGGSAGSDSSRGKRQPFIQECDGRLVLLPSLRQCLRDEVQIAGARRESRKECIVDPLIQ